MHSNGTPVAGYTVSHESIPDFTCSGNSAGAVDPDIEWCGFSSTGTVACWKSSNHTVLCLHDPMRKHLVRIRYQGAFSAVAAPHHPSPQSLVLHSGNYCLVRDGGAWSDIVGHPSWYCTYGCRHDAIYGGSGDGINRSVNPWRVQGCEQPREQHAERHRRARCEDRVLRRHRQLIIVVVPLTRRRIVGCEWVPLL